VQRGATANGGGVERGVHVVPQRRARDPLVRAQLVRSEPDDVSELHEHRVEVADGARAIPQHARVERADVVARVGADPR
jgi:hypothetical protein